MWVSQYNYIRLRASRCDKSLSLQCVSFCGFGRLCWATNSFYNFWVAASIFLITATFRLTWHEDKHAEVMVRVRQLHDLDSVPVVQKVINSCCVKNLQKRLLIRLKFWRSLSSPYRQLLFERVWAASILRPRRPTDWSSKRAPIFCVSFLSVLPLLILPRTNLSDM